jgi:anti-sigma-K factor RskA
VTTHEEARHLLAAFALDAVRRDELERIEAHVSECPRCRIELDGHREVAAGLGTIVEPLPEGLWGSISKRLSASVADELPRRPTRLRDAAHSARLHFPRGRLASAASAAVGAAAVATALGVSVIHADNQVAHLQDAVSEAARNAVVAAMKTTGHRIVNLDDAQQHRLAEFVVLRNGRGYLVSSHLPSLSSKNSYQLWGVVNGQTISVGLLGRVPHLSTFTLVDAHPPFGLGLTVEPPGGSVRPSGPMLASGTVSAG